MKILEKLRILFFNSISAAIFLFLKIKFHGQCVSQQNKILFVNSGLLGDNILASLILVNDKLFEPYEDVSILINGQYKTLFTNYEGTINLLYYCLDSYKNNLRYRIKLLKKIRRKNFAVVYNINFVQHTIDDEITIIGTCKDSYAFENNKKLVRFYKGLYTRHLTSIMTLTSGNNFYELSQLIESITTSGIIHRTKLYIDWGKDSPKLNLTTKNYVVIAPFSSKFVKEYRLEDYSELINHISSNFDMSVIVVGENEARFFDSTNKKIINLTGLTNLLEVLLLIKNCKLFIGNDSGLLHAAIALEKYSVGIVGGGVWGRIYPYGDFEKVDYFYKYLDCFNCDWHCVYNVPRCLYEIDTKKLYEIIGERLKSD